MIQSIVISVYDATLGNLGMDVLDFAEKGSIRWSWEGGEDKFIAMMGSRLEFDMEVSIEESQNTLVYDYLFTGNETRYKVVMQDQDGRYLWQGFLLPEEYNEPYTTGTFFVHLTATDGLGRLKGHTLDRQLYRVKHSVPKLIADCLKKTGLELDIFINPAIWNGAASRRWDYVYVDGADFSDSDSFTDCYEILESLVTDMGCTLYQQNNRWYIQSWADRSRPTGGVQWQVYDVNGVYVTEQSEFATNSVSPIKWWATPFIGIKPPFKQVKVTTGIDENINILPEDIVKQKWQIKDIETEAPPLQKYWRATSGIDVKLFPVSIGAEFDTYEGNEMEESGVIGFKVIPSIPVDSRSNYITMKNPVFMKAGKIDFDFYFTYFTKSAIGYGDQFYHENMVYEVTLDGVVIMSNDRFFTGYKNFDWKGEKISNPGVNEYMPARVEIKGFRLKNSGFLNIKLFHPNSSISPPYTDLRIDDFRIQYSDPFTNVFPRRRNIDFTTTKELSLFNGDSAFDGIEKNFTIQDPPVLSYFEEIQIYGGRLYMNRWASNVSRTNLNKIISNRTKIYLKRDQSDFYEYIRELETVSIIPFALFAVILTLPDDYKATAGDKLYIYNGPPPVDPQTTSCHNFREQWFKDVHPNGAQRLGNAMAEMMHDLYPSQLIMFEGELEGLVMPNDVLMFQIRNSMKHFVPLRIEVMPNENKSTVSLLEWRNDKVTDYGG